MIHRPTLSPQPATDYGISIAAVLAAVLLRLTLDPWLGDSLPLVTLFGAVGVSVWFAGSRPAIVAAILGYLFCAYLFIPPRGSLGLDQVQNVVGFLAYLFTCALIIGFGESSRKARQKAEFRREILRVTMASMGDAVITTDNEGKVTVLNGMAETLTGWRNAEAQGQPLELVFRIVNEQTRRSVENPATRALREGAIVGLANHTVLIRKDGSELPIEDSAAPIRDNNGEVVGSVLIFRDVTKQRKAEAIARARLSAAQFLASIVESSEDAIVSKSLDGTIQSWNQAAERLFGYPAEEMIGQHISRLIPAPRLAEEETILSRLRRGERVEHFETVRIRRDGQPIDVSLTISPIREESGQVIGASKIARDITRQKQVEAALKASEEALRQADRRKDEFLAILAHELRNPLAPITNSLEIMKRAGADPEVSKQAHSTIERQMGQMVRLIDDLLDVSRITRNNLELRKERTELQSIILHAVETCRPQIESAGHQLSVNLPREPIYLHGDPMRLAQVFSNLLTNACKYTDDGGQIELKLEQKDDTARITFKDSGIGIPSEYTDKVFEMFVQVDRTLERTRGGLGIGLTLVKELVELHGGMVSAFSEGIGKGSEFIVEFPMSDEVPNTQVVNNSHPAKSAITRRVLIVDDNRDSARTLALLLKMNGHETATAHDGEEALRQAEVFNPDAMLLDIGLPKRNGYEVCQATRQQEWGKKLFIVAMTGWGQETDRRKSQDAGFNAHLVKPVNFADLSALLHRLPSSQDE